MIDADVLGLTDFEIAMCNGSFEDGLKMILSKIQNAPTIEPEQRWIPCSERVPEQVNKSYWVCTDTGYQCQCRWTNNLYGFGESDEWEWKIFDIPQYTKVIAWMPLPEPYKGGSE